MKTCNASYNVAADEHGSLVEAGQVQLKPAMQTAMWEWTVNKSSPVPRRMLTHGTRAVVKERTWNNCCCSKADAHSRNSRSRSVWNTSHD